MIRFKIPHTLTLLFGLMVLAVMFGYGDEVQRGTVTLDSGHTLTGETNT